MDERSRFHGATAVMRVLEDDPAVEDVFATEEGIDARWRRARERP